ncbi:MAG: hypothetical protein H6993_12725 [Pseudomonadales bacterium]|nr:hypothetical protein [Pseudomonadales bacterium]MCP5184822.1 hypothetical protein [Pseudomonadales bacterium]
MSTHPRLPTLPIVSITRRELALVLLLATSPMQAVSQDASQAPPHADAGQASNDSTSATPAQADSNRDETGAPAKSAAKPSPDQEFTPSESISEDFAVSFPVDI